MKRVNFSKQEEREIIRKRNATRSRDSLHINPTAAVTAKIYCNFLDPYGGYLHSEGRCIAELLLVRRPNGNEWALVHDLSEEKRQAILAKINSYANPNELLF